MNRLTLNALDRAKILNALEVIETIENLSVSLPLFSEKFTQEYLNAKDANSSSEEKELKTYIRCLLSLIEYFDDQEGGPAFISTIYDTLRSKGESEAQSVFNSLISIDAKEFKTNSILSDIDTDELVGLGLLRIVKPFVFSGQQIAFIREVLSFYEAENGPVSPISHDIQTIELIKMFSENE